MKTCSHGIRAGREAFNLIPLYINKTTPKSMRMRLSEHVSIVRNGKMERSRI